MTNQKSALRGLLCVMHKLYFGYCLSEKNGVVLRQKNKCPREKNRKKRLLFSTRTDMIDRTALYTGYGA